MKDKVVEIRIREPSGVPRSNYPVTCGIPFPQGQLRDTEGLRLELKSGQEIPLQVVKTASWPDKSVKWALFDFQISVEPTEEKILNLHFGEGVRRQGLLPSPLSVKETEDSMCVNSGPLTFEVKAGGPHPFQKLNCDGTLALRQGLPLLTLRSGGRLYTAYDPDSTVVLEDCGPLRVVLKCEGQYVTEGGSKFLNYIVRIYAYAGQPFLRIYHTLVNREPTEKVEISELSFHLPLVVSNNATGYALGTADHYKPFRVHRMKDELSLCIPTEEGPTPSVRQAAGYYLVRPGEDGRSESKYPGPQWHSPMLGSATLADGDRGVTLMLRYPWHNAPKEFHLDSQGITLYLYPSWEPPLELYRGVAKTHEMLILFHLEKPEELELKRQALAFQEPMVATVATRNWMAASGAFGPLFRYQPKKYAWYEYIFRRLFEQWVWNPDKTYHKGTTLMDFGDHWVPSRGGQWKNNEMDFGYALILQFVRTGYPVIFPWIEQVVMHQIDVDTCHDSENPVEIGSQRYHYADHGWHVPFIEQGWAFPVQLCHEWLEGPLFFYFLTGYRRALETALARAEHFVRAIEAGYHRQKTIARVSGYPLMALSTMQANFPNESYIQACERILDWLEKWTKEEGALIWNTFGPERVDMAEGALGHGVIMQGLMRYHRVTGSKRAWKLLVESAEYARKTVFTPEDFAVKLSSLRRNYLAPGESDFIIEPLAYLAERTGNKKYLEIAYKNLKLALVARDAVRGPGHPPTEEYRFWLPFLDYADRAGILRDLILC
ncbi:MAG: hypothetical protein B1H40_00990 [Candidatus Latescibacteria bacterium 4484_181]|nr:MAG: hypothetical protein B1H40_00990 [Candidatus Latescibacteria bacterium 4484_181]RKY69090.1 MAG: hypothetical protein DRQ02_02140 [Candidatus Latescibacterota bacterium]RKY73706.1 MAG: hypothetical protein DRQ24_01835 [Candidatus Latescibacterota bacterium]